MEDFDKCSTMKLFYRLLDDTYLDKSSKIKEEVKHNISIPVFRIQNSKIVGKPEDKFETMLFLPPNPNRIAEEGLRTKGLFKFSYKKVESVWYICDLDGNPAIPAPDEIQDKINSYINQFNIQHPTSNIISKLPLITVITVVYNGAKYLEDTIKSVINQTYPNVEYIIIDGGSRDGTLDIIKKYEDYVDYWVSEPDKGIYDAMNKGIDLATGQWINFMNAGDKFFNDNIIFFIYQNVKSLNSNYDIVYGKVGIINEKGEIDAIYGLNEKESFKKLKKYMSISHQSTFYRLEFFKKTGKYDNDFKIAGDYEILLRNYKNLQIKFLDSILSLMLNNGISQTQITKVFKEFTRAKLKNKDKIRVTNTKIYIYYLVMMIKRIIKILLKILIKK